MKRRPMNLAARPQRARVRANADAFQPAHSDVVGDLNRPPVDDGQTIEVRASGDLVTGGDSGGDDRTPEVAV
jgi:hypothetical protein